MILLAEFMGIDARVAQHLPPDGDERRIDRNLVTAIAEKAHVENLQRGHEAFVMGKQFAQEAREDIACERLAGEDITRRAASIWQPIGSGSRPGSQPRRHAAAELSHREPDR